MERPSSRLKSRLSVCLCVCLCACGPFSFAVCGDLSPAPHPLPSADVCVGQDHEFNCGRIIFLYALRTLPLTCYRGVRSPRLQTSSWIYALQGSAQGYIGSLPPSTIERRAGGTVLATATRNCQQNETIAEGGSTGTTTAPFLSTERPQSRWPAFPRRTASSVRGAGPAGIPRLSMCLVSLESHSQRGQPMLLRQAMQQMRLAMHRTWAATQQAAASVSTCPPERLLAAPGKVFSQSETVFWGPALLPL